MRLSVAVLILFFDLSAMAFAQHRTAPNGYYPNCYHGDMWTGVISAVNDERGEIALTDTDPSQNRAETFVGVIEGGYTVRRHGEPPHALKPSELPQGMHLTVYYCSESKKVAGKKTIVNTIFQMDKVPNLKEGYFQFKAFR